MKTLAGLAVLLLLLASPATAQEIKDNTYTNAKLKVQVSVPKDWTLTQGEEETLCEFEMGEDVGGMLDHWESTDTAEKKADDLEGGFKSLENCKDFKKVKNEKLKKQPGEWLLREYTMTYEDVPLHYAYLYVARDGHLYALATWCGDADWAKNKEAMYKVIDSFAFTDSKPGGKEATKDPEPGGGDEKPTMEVMTTDDPWKGCGKGSWVKYKAVQGGMETEIKYVLVDRKENEFYTMRQETVVQGNKSVMVMKFVIKKDGGSGGGGGGEKPKIEEGEETIKVGKREFKCKWIKSTTSQGWYKNWSCDDVPYRLVKNEAEMMGNKMSMELVDFEKK